MYVVSREFRVIHLYMTRKAKKTRHLYDADNQKQVQESVFFMTHKISRKKKKNEEREKHFIVTSFREYDCMV